MSSDIKLFITIIFVQDITVIYRFHANVQDTSSELSEQKLSDLYLSRLKTGELSVLLISAVTTSFRLSLQLLEQKT